MVYEQEPNLLDYEPNVGMSFGMYVGDAPVTVGDPWATYMKIPTTYSFYEGLQESRI